MQYMEGLSDRQAAEAVRERIDWKYARSLELTDPGFDFSLRIASFVHGGFRGEQKRTCCTPYWSCAKVVAGSKHEAESRTDSTHVLAAIRDLNRLECAGETLRHRRSAASRGGPRLAADSDQCGVV